jgi:hypothetical protein
MNAELTALSQPGEYAEFTLSLPAGREPEKPRETPHKRPTDSFASLLRRMGIGWRRG